MEYYNNILTVEAGWMIEQGVMSATNYRNLSNRGDIQVVRRACRNTPALVAYDSMPDRYKKAIVERVGDPRKQARQNVLEGLIEHSAAATTFFEDYMIDDDRHLPADKRREYYTNAVVLDAVKRLIESRNSKRKALGNRATRFWDEISQAVQELDLTKWPHTLPANARSLERKYQRYLAEGFGSLVHKAYQTGSKNAAKVADDNQKAMLVTFMSDPRNLDNEQVASLYNMVAQQMDWKKITASAVAVWRDKCDEPAGGKKERSTRTCSTWKARKARNTVKKVCCASPGLCTFTACSSATSRAMRVKSSSGSARSRSCPAKHPHIHAASTAGTSPSRKVPPRFSKRCVPAEFS